MAKTIYPKALKPGDRIAITAPSAGLLPPHFPRLELVMKHLRDQGFEVVEGECLRKRFKHVSAPKEKRAQELMCFLQDDSIAAIMPPWGGEILIELLPLLDFDRIRASKPKWISGYSDVSTLLFSLTMKTGIATLHGSNLMDLAPSQTDPLTTGLMKALSLNAGERFTQYSSEKYQKQWLDFEKHPDAPLNLTETTQWKLLNNSQKRETIKLQGRILGGCLDTIARLVGTTFGDFPRYVRDNTQDQVILYFENCELLPCELARTLWNLRLAGWFESLAGILIGRSAGPDATLPENLSYEEVLSAVLGDLSMPILYDIDIGHRPPQLNLINGSFAEVFFDGKQGTVTQTLV